MPAKKSAKKTSARECACGQKVAYPTEASAVRAADVMNGKPRTRKFLEAYPCAYCSQWHIGRRMSDLELRLRAAVGAVLSRLVGEW